MGLKKLNIIIEKLSNVLMRLREKGLIEEANEVEEVIELLIPEEKPDEIDLQGVEELKEAIKKNELISYEELMRELKEEKGWKLWDYSFNFITIIMVGASLSILS